MTKQGFFCLGYGRVFILALTFLLLSNCPFAAAQGTSESARFRVFPLKHISVEQGKKYLAEAEIGTVSHLSGTTALLVTGPADELIKAKAILGLVDSQEPFVVTAILPASTARNMPSNEQIAAQVDNISIGNFSNPPDDDTASKAIIDIHGDSLVVVAPGSRFREILFAVEQLEKKAAQVKKQPVEKDIRARQPAVPYKPKAVATVPQRKVWEQKAPEPPSIVRTYEPKPIANGEQTINLDLPEKFDITLLLGLVGPYLNLDFMYDPAKVSGEVTLMLQGKLQGPIKVKDLYPMLESVLKFKGFVMTRHKGNLVTVVPKEEALEIDPELVDADKDEIEYGDLIVTRVFKLEHIDTTSAKNLLEAMKLTVDVTPIAETKTLIVTAFAHRMLRIETLLDVVDKPGEPKKFRFRQLQYTMAKTLAPKIQTLAEQLGTVSIAIAAEPETPAAASPKRAGESDAAYRTRLLREAEARRRAALARQAAQKAAAPEPAKPTVYLDADERTNRILMIGLEEQLTAVEELIDTLDVEQQDLRTMRLYRIEHADAEEVKNKLEELEIISPSPMMPPYSRITTPSTAQKPVPTKAQMLLTGTTEEALVEEPQVVVVQATNSLLVSATEEQHTQIAEVLGYVDSEPEAINYKVYPLENQDPNHLAGVLEKLIVETTTKEDKDAKIVTTTKEKRLEEEIIIIPEPKTYSLIVYASKENQQWISVLIQQLDEYRPQVLLDVTLVEVTKNEEFTLDLDMVTKFPKFAAGASMDYLTAKIDPFPVKQIAEAVSIGGSGSGFYADEHIQALLTAMHQKGYGRILARPKLLVNDNEEGTIEAKETQTIVSPKTEVIPGTAATAPTAATSVELKEYDAGITLIITPHISKGDQLRLSMTLTRVDFRRRDDYIITGREGDIKGPTPPDLLTSDVTTTVTVPDRSTIILGGLEKLTQNKGGTKVPLLGDIPLVGGLFRSTANTDTQSRLYVFVKAHILRPGEEPTGQSDLELVSAHNRATFEKYEAEMQAYENWPGIKPKPMDPARILETNNLKWRIANRKD